MPRSSWLTVILPHPLSGADRTVVNGDAGLAQLAGRGSLERRWHPDDERGAQLTSWQRAVLAALALADEDYPSATVTAHGAGLAERACDWLHAEPIHLAAGLNDVTLVPLRGDLALTVAERAALAPMLGSHVADCGHVFCETPSREWLIGAAEPWRVHTVTPEFAIHSEWREALPGGEGAAAVHRLATELQMLLHEHPVNEDRIARGVPAANALWLWGNGAVNAQLRPVQVLLMGSNDYVRGLCRVQQWPAPVDVQDVDALIVTADNREHVVAILSDTDLVELESHWLPRLTEAVRRGEIGRLEIAIDGWRVDVNRWHLRRFWRGPLPMAQWGRA